MARRFSRVLRGPTYNAAFNTYIQYWQGRATRPTNIGGGTERGVSQRVTVNPFGKDLATGTRAIVLVSARARTQLQAAVGARAAAVQADDQRVPSFSPAKLVGFVAAGAGTVATSELTGMRYLRRAGESYSHPFGRASDTELEMTAFNVVSTAFIGTATNRRASYQAERFRLN